jgi:hypothetical protein
MCAPSSDVASASIFCNSASVSTELSVALTSMIPEADAVEGKSRNAIASACVDWYDAGKP